MMTLHIDIAEIIMQECQNKFDYDIRQGLRPDSSIYNKYLHLNESMIAILQRYFKIIERRRRYLYQQKVTYLEKKFHQRQNSL